MGSPLRKALVRAAHHGFEKPNSQNRSNDAYEEATPSSTKNSMLVRVPNALAPGLARLRSLPVPAPAQQLAKEVKRRITKIPLLPPPFFSVSVGGKSLSTRICSCKG